MADNRVPPFQSYTSRSSNSAPRTPGKALYIVLVILLLVVVGIGAAQFLSSRSGDVSNIVSVPIEFNEPTPTASPTPIVQETVEESSESAELDRSDISIVVQNGSGKAGVAGSASTTLKNLGYSIHSTGNADKYDYEETVIRISAENKEYLELLRDDLSETYTIGETSTNYTGTGDALIIIGQE